MELLIEKQLTAENLKIYFELDLVHIQWLDCKNYF
jgi:hypothetical protein